MVNTFIFETIHNNTHIYTNTPLTIHSDIHTFKDTRSYTDKIEILLLHYI